MEMEQEGNPEEVGSRKELEKKQEGDIAFPKLPTQIFERHSTMLVGPKNTGKSTLG
jgi:polynucleotide 5'-kinase involved in rRNA processing